MSKTRFATDAEMNYRASRTRFLPGGAFRLDEIYRFAQLPLVAPGHPDVIAEAKGYRMGIHAPVFSLVLPVVGGALEASDGYQAIIARLKHSRISRKIAWDRLAQRRDKLHATLAGQITSIDMGMLTPELRNPLAELYRFRYRIAGLFSGDRNHGRLYLKAYPEMRGETSVLADIARIFGRVAPDLVLIGVFNLTDHLDAAETSDLSAILDEFCDTHFVDVEADALSILTSRDDLALDAAYTDRISLL